MDDSILTHPTGAVPRRGAIKWRCPGYLRELFHVEVQLSGDLPVIKWRCSGWLEGLFYVKVKVERQFQVEVQ
jgi:hypothetical protein